MTICSSGNFLHILFDEGHMKFKNLFKKSNISFISGYCIFIFQTPLFAQTAPIPTGTTVLKCPEIATKNAKGTDTDTDTGWKIAYSKNTLPGWTESSSADFPASGTDLNSYQATEISMHTEAESGINFPYPDQNYLYFGPMTCSYSYSDTPAITNKNPQPITTSWNLILSYSKSDAIISTKKTMKAHGWNPIGNDGFAFNCDTNPYASYSTDPTRCSIIEEKPSQSNTKK